MKAGFVGPAITSVVTVHCRQRSAGQSQRHQMHASFIILPKEEPHLGSSLGWCSASTCMSHIYLQLECICHFCIVHACSCRSEQPDHHLLRQPPSPPLYALTDGMFQVSRCRCSCTLCLPSWLEGHDKRCLASSSRPRHLVR